MKRFKMFLAFFVVIGVLCSLMIISVSAEEGWSPWMIETVGGSNEPVPVSRGLDVIAAQNTTAVAGIEGNALYFSAERFACAMNLKRVYYVTVTKLPDIACGGLYIGSEGVSVGQRIKASELSLMTYEEADGGVGKTASFEFMVNDSGYSVACKIYMLDEVNYSPTVSLAPFASLNTETYRDIGVSGVLSAYDPEGDAVRFEIVRFPKNGRVMINDDSIGTYTYVPFDSFTGDDSFEYVVSDIYGNYSSSATVNVNVSAQSTPTVYNDMLQDELYSHAISVTERGLMNGVRVGDYFYFEADREVSRADFVVTAMNAIGIKSVPDVESTLFYDDADINNEMKGYVALAYSKGYISGSKIDGKLCFKPDETITLSEAAVIISNMIGYAEPKVTPVFADADSIPSWSGKAIESLHTLGILEAPEMISGACETVTRGDMAKLLNKTIFVIGK